MFNTEKLLYSTLGNITAHQTIYNVLFNPLICAFIFTVLIIFITALIKSPLKQMVFIYIITIAIFGVHYYLTEQFIKDSTFAAPAPKEIVPFIEETEDIQTEDVEDTDIMEIK